MSPSAPPNHIDLEALDLSRLAELVGVLYTRLEGYEQDFAAAPPHHRVSVSAGLALMESEGAALDVQTELARWGLVPGVETGGSRERSKAILELQELLAEMRGWNPPRPPPDGPYQLPDPALVLAWFQQCQLPDPASWLARLRLCRGRLRPSDQGGARQGEGIAGRKDQGKTRRTKRRLEESDKETDKLKLQVYHFIQRLHRDGEKPADILAKLKADGDCMEQVRQAKLQANKKLIRAALAVLGQRERDAASRRKNQDSPPP